MTILSAVPRVATNKRTASHHTSMVDIPRDPSGYRGPQKEKIDVHSPVYASTCALLCVVGRKMVLIGSK